MDCMYEEFPGQHQIQRDIQYWHCQTDGLDSAIMEGRSLRMLYLLESLPVCSTNLHFLHEGLRCC